MSDLTKEVRDGVRDGQELWVCDFRQPDLNKKAARNIAPTMCLVVSNDALPKNKTVYYSNSHFVPYNSKGKLTKKVIGPVDNTGFRCRSGVYLQTFRHEKECVDFWNKQVQEVIYAVEFKIKTARIYWENTKKELAEKLL